MIKYFRFTPLLDSESGNLNKIDEEWSEWNASFGTDDEPEELIDLIHSLCNYFENKFGYSRMKKEDLANIIDIQKRYPNLLK